MTHEASKSTIGLSPVVLQYLLCGVTPFSGRQTATVCFSPSPVPTALALRISFLLPSRFFPQCLLHPPAARPVRLYHRYRRTKTQTTPEPRTTPQPLVWKGFGVTPTVFFRSEGCWKRNRVVTLPHLFLPSRYVFSRHRTTPRPH